MASDSDASSILDPVVKEAQERFHRCQQWESQAQKWFLSDYKFCEGDAYNGYQWPNEIKRNRDVDERPCLTLNQVRQHNLQIINDALQNPTSIDVRPTGAGASYESSQVWNSLMKHIEYRSSADVAYAQQTAFMVKGGWGFLRLMTRYVDSNSFDQEALIRGLNDPLTGYLDPEAKEPGKLDAEFGFIFDDMDKKEFDKQYPQWKDVASATPIDGAEGWFTSEKVRRCEYYRKVRKKDTLYAVTDAQGQPQMIRKSVIKASDQYKDIVAELDADDSVQKREVEDITVEYKLILGHKVVEESIWPGKYIPLIPMIAEETIIEGIMDRKGHTRSMIDPQRMYNYWAPLALDTPVPTPNGWTIIDKITAGDVVLSDQGKPCTVLGTSPVYLHRKCYRIEFDDGSHITADGEHKWTVEEKGKRQASTWDWQRKTIRTDELTPKKHFIWQTLPLELPEETLPIHPYLLGAWLGDGDTACPRITSGWNDIEEMRRKLVSLGYDVSEPQIAPGKTAGTLGIRGMVPTFTAAGLIGNKHIPDVYLRASKEQRLELLRGLMDTDGSISANNQCSFTTISDKIAVGIEELLRTLGIKSVYCVRARGAKVFPSGETYDTGAHFQFSFTADPKMRVFNLTRKSILQNCERPTHTRRTKRHRIVSVLEVPSVPVKCITVDNESHLFLAGPGMVPTHNSAGVEYGALQSKTPYIGAAEAIEGYETYWNTANVVNHSILPYKSYRENQPDVVIPPPQRQEPPVAAPVCLTGMQLSQNEMMLVSGQQPSQMGQPGNERSGVAIGQRQRQSDNATYHYVAAKALAIATVGRQLLDLIPKLYDTRRTMLILADDLTPMEVTLDPKAAQVYQMQQKQNTETVSHVLNPTMGQYEVQADTGPGYATRREEAFEAFKLILTQNPMLTSVLGDILFRAGDFPHAGEAAQRLKRLVPPHALGQGPSPQEQMMQQQLQQMQGLLAKSMEDLAKEKIRYKGKEQQKDIDAYSAFTQRLQVLFKARADEDKLAGEAGAQDAKVSLDDIKGILAELQPDMTGMGLQQIPVENADPMHQMGNAAGGLGMPGLPNVAGFRTDPSGRSFVRDSTHSRVYQPI